MIARVNIIMNYELLENSLSGIYVYTQNPGAALLFRKPHQKLMIILQMLGVMLKMKLKNPCYLQ